MQMGIVSWRRGRGRESFVDGGRSVDGRRRSTGADGGGEICTSFYSVHSNYTVTT